MAGPRDIAPWPFALGCFQLATLDSPVSGEFATRASRTAREARALPRGRQSESRLSPKKFLKKVLTLKSEIQYQRGWLQSRGRIFTR
jgi:hypothetical protein